MRLAVLADRDVGEDTFRDLVRIGAVAASHPRLHSDLERGVALLLQPAEDADIIADVDGRQKLDRLNADGDDPLAELAACATAA